MSSRLDVAYYYPAPYWGERESGWVKSLLLFFDKVAILLPGYMYGRHHFADPVLSQPLEDLGLLEVLEPSKWVDEEMARSLAEAIIGLLANGVFDDLRKDVTFHELSQSRIGYGADIDLAQQVVSELQEKGLAKPSEDGVSIPLHPTVRTTILVILAQLARSAGRRQNRNLHPTTNNTRAIDDLTHTLSRERMPSRDSVIALDLEPVSFNLDSQYLSMNSWDFGPSIRPRTDRTCVIYGDLWPSLPTLISQRNERLCSYSGGRRLPTRLTTSSGLLAVRWEGTFPHGPSGLLVPPGQLLLVIHWEPCSLHWAWSQVSSVLDLPNQIKSPPTPTYFK